MKKATIAAGLLVLWAGAGRAQTTTGTLVGRLQDATGGALSGAEVSARHLESGLLRTTTSSVTGEFTLAALPVGEYEVRAALAGFRPVVQSGPDVQNNFGGGTYTLKGEDYAETLTYHVAPALVGRTLHFKLVVKGDTMTLTGPVSTEDQKVLGGTLTEVYVWKD